MSKILVMGHTNPDNDSIASAVAYAYLKNIIDPDNEYIPVRLGPMPKETSWVFEEFNVPVPMAVPHVHIRVQDVMTKNPISIPGSTTMLEAGRIFREKGVRALVVLEKDGTYGGIISLRKLAELYVSEEEITGFTHAPVTLGNLARSFNGKIAYGEPNRRLNGKLLIGANEPKTAAAAVSPGDTIITGNRKRTQPLVVEAGAACLVLSCGAQPSDELLALCQEKNCALLLTDYDTYTSARLASLAQTVDTYADKSANTFSPEDLIADAAGEILGSQHRESVVLDDAGYAIGIVTRSDLARPTKREVILVDHNEVSQSAPGIEDARVLEIVDHHRIGDVQTSEPILFLNYPWGSTSTIVARQYRINLVDMPRDIAAVLLSGIMTDTVLLKSSGTTEEDRKQARHLGEVLYVDPVEFGIDVIKSRGSAALMDIEDIIGRDSKEYRIGDHHMLIAQYETVDHEAALARMEEGMRAMEITCRNGGYDTMLLMVTDLIGEGSEFICVGNTKIIERAFDISFDEGSVWMPGILSRAMQVVPRLIEHGAV